MNRHHGIVRNIFQGILHGMEAGEASFDQPLRAKEILFHAILSPVIHMRFRKNGNHLNIRNCPQENLNGPAQDGDAAEEHELFGKGRPHTGSASSRRDKQVFFSVHPENFFSRI